MASVIPMPARGDRSAPKFDPKRPRELRRYFADLEFILDRAQITDETEKKKHASRYVDVDTSELWEMLAEFSDANKSLSDFQATVHELYPRSDEERKWSVANMDQLVGERSCIGIMSLAELGEYYCSFLAITTFLRNKGRLSEAEQSCTFVRGFLPDIWRTVSQRLQLKFPDHFPNNPYLLTNVHEAARFVLLGTSANPSDTTPAAMPATLLPATVQSALTSVKSEEFAMILERIDTLMKNVKNPHRRTGSVATSVETMTI